MESIKKISKKRNTEYLLGNNLILGAYSILDVYAAYNQKISISGESFKRETESIKKDWEELGKDFKEVMETT
ncbi:hypothetical protein [Aquirufa aurantiipilula]